MHTSFARVNGVTYEIFRITCGKDGSIYVHFPYVPEGGALVGEVLLDPQIRYPATLTVGPDFSTTIHNLYHNVIALLERDRVAADEISYPLRPAPHRRRIGGPRER